MRRGGGGGGVRKEGCLGHKPNPHKKMTEPQQRWIELSQKVGYEGAALIVQNTKQELMFMVSNDSQGNLRAEMPGGKPEEEDQGDSLTTALREMKEETGLQFTKDDILSSVKMETVGGTTGVKSVQFLTKPLEVTQKPNCPKGFYVRWSKVYFDRLANKWTIDDGVPIRRFNTFFLFQNKDVLDEFIVRKVD